MAAVRAELKLRDGSRQKVFVHVEPSLSSVMRGLRELNARASRLLSELLERERGGDCAEGEDDDGEEDDEPDDPQNSELQPPVKRSRTQNT